MELTPTNFNIFFTDLETRYWMAIGTTKRWSDKFVTLYPTKTEAWLSGWIGMVNKMRVWNGPRVIREPAPQTYSVPILPYELTEAIDMFKLMDDSHGIYFPLVSMMGASMAKWQDYSVRDLLQGNNEYAGALQTGTDGLSNWNAAHPVDFWDSSLGTYPNDYGSAGLSVNGITVGGTLSTNAYVSLWEDMSGRKNEAGEAQGIEPNELLVPSQLKFQSDLLTKSAFFSPPVFGSLGSAASGQPNAPFVGNMDSPLRGSTDTTWTPDLNGQPTAYYMLDTTRAIKPFGWVSRQAPVFVIRNAPTDPVVFDQHRILYGAWARAVAAWAQPFMSSRSGV